MDEFDSQDPDQNPYNRPKMMTPTKFVMPNHANANAAEMYKHGRSIL
jgi:hypothetical protein